MKLEIQKKDFHPILFAAKFKQELLDHREAEGCKAVVQSNQSQLQLLLTEHDYSQDIDDQKTYHFFEEKWDERDWKNNSALQKSPASTKMCTGDGSSLVAKTIGVNSYSQSI